MSKHKRNNNAFKSLGLLASMMLLLGTIPTRACDDVNHEEAAAFLEATAAAHPEFAYVDYSPKDVSRLIRYINAIPPVSHLVASGFIVSRYKDQDYVRLMTFDEDGCLVEPAFLKADQWDALAKNALSDPS